VGRKIVPLLLARGYNVRAFVHSNNPFQTNANLEAITGDVHSEPDIVKAVDGVDAVVSVLGSWHTKTKDIQVSAMQHLIPTMQAAGIQRIVSLTGSGAFDPADKLTLGRRLARVIPLKVFKDGSEHIALLRASGLNWTVLRSPVMKEQGLKPYDITAVQPGMLSTISRDSVAAAMAELIESDKWTHQAPYIKSAKA